ncbi:hypothetical protein RJ639_033355 [Escallonia herrerae]|uniref:Uncharacterized protein n=1 Tax=Escallonia herrerae TaxID=1293975 RepID=A0AA88WVL3_9ASTE|nr:hypothetical protein RJ639_033355 [Escallonia herrerae]
MCATGYPQTTGPAFSTAARRIVGTCLEIETTADGVEASAGSGSSVVVELAPTSRIAQQTVASAGKAARQALDVSMDFAVHRYMMGLAFSTAPRHNASTYMEASAGSESSAVLELAPTSRTAQRTMASAATAARKDLDVRMDFVVMLKLLDKKM